MMAARHWITCRKLVDEGKKPEEEFLMMISDIEMPEMDGYTLTAEIRNRSTHAKIAYHPAYFVVGRIQSGSGQEVGADDFLAKFRPDDLASRVVDRIKAADALRGISLAVLHDLRGGIIVYG